MKVTDYYKLSAPFPEADIEWRLARSGKNDRGFWGQVLAYITSRAVQQRLDDVCGPDGWQTEIIPTGNGAYLCKLSIKFDYYDKDGNYTHSEWITRVDGSDESNIEAVKGGISGSVKRAAVQFGVGRYLYNLKDNWAIISKDGKYSGQAKNKDNKTEWFKWDPPKLPSWALPGGSGVPNEKAEAREKAKEKANENNLSPEAKAERDKELKQQIALAESFLNTNIVPAAKIETIKLAISSQDLPKLKTINTWCQQQVDAAVDKEAAEQ